MWDMKPKKRRHGMGYVKFRETLLCKSCVAIGILSRHGSRRIRLLSLQESKILILTTSNTNVILHAVDECRDAGQVDRGTIRIDLQQSASGHVSSHRTRDWDC